MSGIGNTVETDLVGEVIELSRMRDKEVWPLARGLCRAVTNADAGALWLWLEIRSDEDARFSEGRAWSPLRIGDVLPICTDDGNGAIRMRLVKSP